MRLGAHQLLSMRVPRHAAVGTTVELAREVARRFNHLYGREPDFEERALEAMKKMGKKNAKLFTKYRKGYQEQGDQEALEAARALLEGQQNIGVADRERLFGFLEGGGRLILAEPQPLLTKASKMPGLDGQKMSKSYNNTIALRDEPEVVENALRTMPTDTNRVRHPSCAHSLTLSSEYTR